MAASSAGFPSSDNWCFALVNQLHRRLGANCEIRQALSIEIDQDAPLFGRGRTVYGALEMPNPPARSSSRLFFRMFCANTRAAST